MGEAGEIDDRIEQARQPVSKVIPSKIHLPGELLQ